MSQELHYTSVPRGLLPGTRGFCTVASTANMAGPLRERLEGLSGYQQVFPPHDPKAALNPVVFSHHRLSLGGQLYSVLSRVACAELDYTSRSNKYAHHVVLDLAERPAGGPAWLLCQPGFMEASWRGEPRFLTAGRNPPQGEQPGGIAHAWQALTGDAGWAGVLAESFLADPHRPAFLIFEPGMEILPLLAEALALLPPECRWDVDFSTYFTKLPQGLTCAWRGVLAGSPEAKRALGVPSALVLDLGGKLGAASGGALVEFARTGIRPDPASFRSALGREPTSSRKASLATANLDPSSDLAGRKQDRRRAYDVIPGLESGAGITDDSRLVKRRSGRSAGLRWVMMLGSIAALLVVCSLFYFYTRTPVSSVIQQANKRVAELKARAVEQKPVAPVDVESTKEAVASQEQAPVPKSKKPVEQAPKKEDPAAKSAVAKAAPKPAPPAASTADDVPLAEFLALPEVHLSQLSSPTTLTDRYAQFKDVRELSFFIAEQSLQANHNGKTWKIIHPSKSRFDESLELSEFEVLPEALSFHWTERSVKKGLFPQLSRLLRDSVLKVEDNGGTRYVVLRSSPQLSKDAISLTRRGTQTDGIKPRHLLMPWATEGSMVGFPWPLRIRRWRIDVFTEPRVKKSFLEGENAALSAQLQTAVIPEWVNLKLAVTQHNLEIDLVPDTDMIFTDRSLWKELTGRAKELNRDLDDLSKQDTGGQGRSKTAEIKKDLDRIGKDLGAINKKMSAFKRMNDNSGSELSLVIALVIDDKTVIDLARIGSFATENP